MADRAQIEAIEAGLSSSNLEDVHDAIIDIGKQGHRELIPRVVPYLTSATAFLREAALLALVFYLRIEEHELDAIRMLELDPDEGCVRPPRWGSATLRPRMRATAAPRGGGAVRVGAGHCPRGGAERKPGGCRAERGELPTERQLPDFDARTNWNVLARVLQRAGLALPAELGRWM